MTIITGAGSGIGRALAVMLAERGHSLALVGRTRSKLAETARLCAVSAPGGVPATVVESDISQSAAAHALIDRVIHETGGVDVLVNCAGVAPLRRIDATDDAVLEHAFRNNTFGPAALIARVWPHFVERRAGCIVNVSSYASHDPFAGFFAYAASKAALDSLARSCHNEGEALGIRAFCVNPGGVETPMLRSLFSKEQLPEARTLQPDEVAAVIVDCIEGRREADRGKPILLMKR